MIRLPSFGSFLVIMHNFIQFVACDMIVYVT